MPFYDMKDVSIVIGGATLEALEPAFVLKESRNF